LYTNLKIFQALLKYQLETYAHTKYLVIKVKLLHPNYNQVAGTPESSPK